MELQGLSGSPGRAGEMDHKQRTEPFFTFNDDPSAVLINNLLDQSQTQTGSVFIHCPSVIGPKKFGKKLCPGRLRNSDAGIADLDFNRSVTGG